MKIKTYYVRFLITLLILGGIWLFPSSTWTQDAYGSPTPPLIMTESISEIFLYYVRKGTYKIYRFILFNPLKFIYVNGPLLGGFGFWNGQDLADICSQLSKGVSAKFWQDNFQQCEIQIDKQVLALCILVWVLLFLVSCYISIQILFLKYYQESVLLPLSHMYMNLLLPPAKETTKSITKS